MVCEKEMLEKEKMLKQYSEKKIAIKAETINRASDKKNFRLLLCEEDVVMDGEDDARKPFFQDHCVFTVKTSGLANENITLSHEGNRHYFPQNRSKTFLDIFAL